MESTIHHRVFCSLFLLACLPVLAQDTITLSRSECEAIFLRNNTLLIAQRLEVSKAEALAMQARLWPNPIISLDEVNLWASKSQLTQFGTELPGFGNGTLGRNQQFALSVEQLIETAGKRDKRTAMEEVNVSKAKRAFENVLRELKREFRSLLTTVQTLQAMQSVFAQQMETILQLTRAVERQVIAGSAPRADFVRLKALQLEYAQQLKDATMEVQRALSELKLLMGLEAGTVLTVSQDDFRMPVESLRSISLQSLLDTAQRVRPDLTMASLDVTYSDKRLDYEVAQRFPDLTVKLGYDRAGNFMYNFLGVGVALDIPLFNRNQGNISHATLELEQARLRYEQHVRRVSVSITTAWQNLKNATDFYQSIEPGFENSLEELLVAYTKNVQAREMNLLQYMDYLHSFAESKRIIVNAIKDVRDKVEELNYSVGIDVVQ